jgi:hypothetical protein
MFHGFLRTLVKVTIACLIVGTIMAHFGITPEQVLKEFGLSQSAYWNSRGKALPGRCPICSSAR